MADPAAVADGRTERARWYVGLPAPVTAALYRYRRWLLLAALSGLVTSGADVGISLVIRHLFDVTLHHKHGFLLNLSGILAIVLGIEAIKTVTRYLRRRSSEVAGQGVTRDLRIYLFSHLVRLPVGFFHRREVGKILLRFVSDLTAIRRFVSSGIADILADGFAVLCVLVAAVAIEWRLGLGLFLLAPVQYVFVRRWNPRIREMNKRVRDQRAKLSGIIEDDLRGIEAIKVFGRERSEIRRVEERSDRMFTDSVSQATYAARSEGGSQAMNGVAMLFVVGFGAWLLRNDVITRGTLIGFYSLFHHVFPSIRHLVLANESAQTSRVQISRVMAFLDREPEMARPAGAPRIEAGEGTLVFEAIDGRVDFSTRRGEIVAILGPTGSGKSTLAAYLLGFRRPASGRVLLDGHDVAELPPSELRRQVAWAAASAPLLQGSVDRNVRFGHRHATTDEVERALHESTLASVIARLSKGLQHRVGTQGRKLSDGERSLVALARALLVARPILLLDEPFAGLDAATVDAVWRNLEARRALSTTLLFTTDASLAARCDRAIVLDAGVARETAAAPWSADEPASIATDSESS